MANKTMRQYLKSGLFLSIFCLTGCAQPPWRQALEGEKAAAGRQLLVQLQEREKQCAPCLDADIKVFFSNHLRNFAASGYLQLAQPSSLKFIASNPLGQPVVAVTSNGRSFQRVASLERNYLHGSVFSYIVKNDLPVVLASGKWGAWLTARIGTVATEKLSIHEDKEQRGLWFKSELPSKYGQFSEHLLVNPQQEQLLARAITTQEERTVATIWYGNWQEVQNCWQPGEIIVSGLDLGGEIHLQLERTQAVKNCPDSAFVLKKPLNFQEQYLP